MTTSGDLQAINDVLVDLANSVDDLTLADAVRLREQLGDTAQQMRNAQSLLDTHILDMLEQPKIVDGKRYRRKFKGVSRWDHDGVLRRIVEHVRVDHETGEVRDVAAAVDALRVAATLYLSGSSQAKRTAMKPLLGIADPMDEGLVEWHRTGTEIEVTPLEE